MAQHADTLRKEEGHYVHLLRAEGATGRIFHTHAYLSGNNEEGRSMNQALTARLEYAFQLPQNTTEAAIYRGAYQGVGVACHGYNSMLGNPVSVFIFQGATAATLAPRLTLNYEWNLGLTSGWHAYDKEKNPNNYVVGSPVTAYLNAEAYLNWQLSRQVDLYAGVSLSHFSNGNTRLPNSGLNTVGLKAGVSYYLNRDNHQPEAPKEIPPFYRHLSCDILFFGAWKQLGFNGSDGPVTIPKSFAVMGFNVTPLYNISHHLSVGPSLDGIYDRSANIGFNEVTERIDYPKTTQQMALGLSGRVEFVMPFFTIDVGVGHHFMNAVGHLNGWYEILALKMILTRHTFLHIGYSLCDFKTPNNLMLGVGVRLKDQRRIRGFVNPK